MESHTKWLRKHVKIGKMITMTVEMWDGYQRFIILFTLLGYMFENVHNRRLQKL